MNELQESVQKVGQIAYSQAAGGAQAGPTPDDGPPDEESPPEDTVEGEFREV